jgi:hypothetical protein
MHHHHRQGRVVGYGRKAEYVAHDFVRRAPHCRVQGRDNVEIRLE